MAANPKPPKVPDPEERAIDEATHPFAIPIGDETEYDDAELQTRQGEFVEVVAVPRTRPLIEYVHWNGRVFLRHDAGRYREAVGWLIRTTRTSVVAAIDDGTGGSDGA